MGFTMSRLLLLVLRISQRVQVASFLRRFQRDTEPTAATDLLSLQETVFHTIILTGAALLE